MIIVFLLSTISLLAYLVYFGIFILLQFLPTGYNPIRHAVSDYAIGKYHTLFNTYVWSSVVAGFAFAFALTINLGPTLVPGWVFILMVLLALVRIGLVFFPTNIEGTRLTRTGAWHYLFAILSFGFIYTIISHMTPVLQIISPWRDIATVLASLETIVLYALIAVVIMLIPPLRKIFGICERIFLTSTDIWFILVSAFLIVKIIGR